MECSPPCHGGGHDSSPVRGAKSIPVTDVCNGDYNGSMTAGAKLEVSDDELRSAVARSRSWRGVQRALGYKDTSGFVGEHLRERATALGISASHFPRHVPWTADQLETAVRECDSWNQVLSRLGVTPNGHNASKVRGYAERHGFSYSHFTREHSRSGETPFTNDRHPDHLRAAGNSIAMSWFARRGYPVSLPVEDRPYDLIVEADGALYRVQVKTATARASNGVVYCKVHRVPSRDGYRIAYEPDDVDFFFIIDIDDNFYIVPIGDVAGTLQVSMSMIEHRKVPH